jgi:hypothetical protein
MQTLHHPRATKDPVKGLFCGERNALDHVEGKTDRLR